MSRRVWVRALVLGVAFAVALGALVAGMTIWSASTWFTSKDPARFDSVSAELADNRPAYDAAAVRELLGLPN